MQIYFTPQLLLLIIICAISNTAWSHGYVGNRFFPSAISINEPFINDKIALPISYSESRTVLNEESWTLNSQLQYAKTITKYFQVSANASYLHIQTEGRNTQNGFDNWIVGVRYNPFLSPASESIFSIALNTQIGGTGSNVVNATSTTTLSPGILFAQGLGILPDSVKFLRPFGFSLSLSPNITTTNYTISSVSWGAVIEYSFPYLQEYVNRYNLALLDHLVPIIEFPFSTCTQGYCRGQTTGTIDPGIILYGKYAQIGIEALIPSNCKTGNKVGGIIQAYLYLDALFPNSIGKPIIKMT